jgi:hypothetical protein
MKASSRLAMICGTQGHQFFLCLFQNLVARPDVPNPFVTDAMNAGVRRPFAILLLWATVVYALGIYLFLNGFLLTRLTLHVENEHPSSPWIQFPIASDQLHADPHQVNVSETLLPKKIPFMHDPPFQRAIIVVIDALRFDFLPQLSARWSDQYFTNRLSVVQELLEDTPESTLLFQFRADPPTTTMQRLKALMTGSLPTFIDAGSNFASSEINEDHLLKHITKRFKNTYFMGDDTWTHLFSDVLNDTTRTFPFDSFKVFDLDTVDHGILGKLWPLLADGHLSTNSNMGKFDLEAPQWDCIVTHFLGVDHCGHTYGPSHPTLAAKLDEMNLMLKRLVQYVDQDTLLVLLGDHGMSVEGDHGGESEEEVMSGLLLHSKRPLTMLQSSGKPGNVDKDYYRQLFSKIHRNREKTMSYDHEAITARLGYDATAYPIVSQIHLVPTLSYLFGIPIPFGNLGSLIPDLLVPQEQADGPTNLFYFIQQFRINSLQVYNYLKMYCSSGKHNGFSTSALDPLYQPLFSADARLAELMSQIPFINWKNDRELSDIELDALMTELEVTLLLYDKFLTDTLKYCKTIWAQFDVGCMVAGSLVLCFALITCLVLYLKPSRINVFYQAFNNAIVRLFTAFSGAIGLAAGLIVAHLSSSESSLWYMYAGKYGLFDKMTIFGWTATFTVLGNIAGIILVSALNHGQNCAIQGILTQVANIPHSHDIYLVLATGLFHALTLGSNSYIVFEDTVVRFILASWCVYWLIRNIATSRHTLGSLKTSRELWFPIFLLIFVEVSATTGLCREEQQPHCSYIHSGTLTFQPRDIETQSTASDFTTKWLPVIATTGFLLVTAAVSFYLPGELENAWTSFYNARQLRRRSYRLYKALYSISICAIILRYVYLVCENTSSTQSIIVWMVQSSVYNRLTSRLSGTHVISATHYLRIITRIFQLYIPRLTYAIAGLFLSLALCTAWKPKNLKELKQATWKALIGSTIVLATIQRPIGGMIILCWPLVLQLLTRASDNSNIHKTLIARLVILHYLGEHLFFVTGHQAILTAFHWEAAYIGFEEMHLIPNAILVSLATLGGFIVSWSSSMVIICDVLDEIQDRKMQSFVYQTSLLLILLFNFIPTSFSSIFIIILRRHLMTWKIFAPRFLLQCILFIGSCLYVITVEGIVGNLISEQRHHTD